MDFMGEAIIMAVVCLAYAIGIMTIIIIIYRTAARIFRYECPVPTQDV